jgi:hypothetical protein
MKNAFEIEDDIYMKACAELCGAVPVEKKEIVKPGSIDWLKGPHENEVRYTIGKMRWFGRFAFRRQDVKTALQFLYSAGYFNGCHDTVKMNEGEAAS